MECASHRGVLVSDSLGKRLHAWYRLGTLPEFEASARKSQCGGISMRGTDLCSHIVTSYVDVTISFALSSLVLFLDVVAAFDSLYRWCV